MKIVYKGVAMVNYERADLTFLNFKRFLARTIDWANCLVAVYFVYYIILDRFNTVNPYRHYLFSYIAYLLMVVLEPVWLHFLATTPGKFLCGIFVYDVHGNKISITAAANRTKKMFIYGAGLNIPIINDICYIISYFKAKNNRYLAWESGCVMVEKKRHLWGHFLSIIWICVCFFLCAILEVCAIFPPNLGTDTSKSQLNENYEYYLDYFNVDYGPSLKIVEEEGIIQQVSFEIEATGSEIGDNYDEIASAAAMAFAATDESTSYLNLNGSIQYLNYESVYDEGFEPFYYGNICIEVDNEISMYYEDMAEIGVLEEIDKELQYCHIVLKMTRK